MGNICQEVLKIILSFHVKKTRKRLNQKVVSGLMKGGTSLVKSSIKPSDECVWRAFLLLNQPLGYL